MSDPTILPTRGPRMRWRSGVATTPGGMPSISRVPAAQRVRAARLREPGCLIGRSPRSRLDPTPGVRSLRAEGASARSFASRPHRRDRARRRAHQSPPSAPPIAPDVPVATDATESGAATSERSRRSSPPEGRRRSTEIRRVARGVQRSRGSGPGGTDGSRARSRLCQPSARAARVRTSRRCPAAADQRRGPRRNAVRALVGRSAAQPAALNGCEVPITRPRESNASTS